MSISVGGRNVLFTSQDTVGLPSNRSVDLPDSRQGMSDGTLGVASFRRDRPDVQRFTNTIRDRLLQRRETAATNSGILRQKRNSDLRILIAHAFPDCGARTGKSFFQCDPHALLGM